MSKLKCSEIVRLRGFGKEFGEKYFTADEIILSCTLCDVKVTAEKLFIMEQHCNTAKHKSSANHQLQHYRKRRLS
jgi:hypothetical protein